MGYRFNAVVAFLAIVTLEVIVRKMVPVSSDFIAADPLTLGIAAVALSAASAGYGVYASERARRATQRSVDEARRDQQAYQAKQDAQMAQDKADMAANLKAQEETQRATNTELAGKQEAARQQALASVPGLQEKLGADLLSQQEYAYKRMAPQMEARLNALGLLQSGALPEAQAKYQGDLESQRQATLASFGTNAQHQLSIQAPQALTEADVNRQSAAMNANLALGTQNLSQQFANQNIANQNNMAYQQYVGNLEAARNAASQQAASAYMNFGGQLASGAMSMYGNQSQKALNDWRNKPTQAQRQYDYWGTGNQGPVR